MSSPCAPWDSTRETLVTVPRPLGTPPPYAVLTAALRSRSTASL